MPLMPESSRIHIGLLRAVNLGSTNKIAMSDLRAIAADLGMRDAKTLLQSGNVVFACDSRSTANLERLFEEETRKRLELATDYFVRTAKEWAQIVEANPFPQEAARDPGHLILLCLKHAPEASAVTALQKAIKGREVVRAVGRQAYIVYPDGVGQSKLTIKMIEKALATRGTGRNWNTVLKLGALAATR
jgi:uncharacterized protein (DUF1697 family)